MGKTENPFGDKLKETERAVDLKNEAETISMQRRSNVLTIKKKDLDQMPKDDGSQRASYKIVVHVPTTATEAPTAGQREDITELKLLTIDLKASKDKIKDSVTKPLPSTSKVLLDMNVLGSEYETLDFPLLLSRNNHSEKVLVPPDSLSKPVRMVVSENLEPQPRPLPPYTSTENKASRDTHLKAASEDRQDSQKSNETLRYVKREAPRVRRTEERRKSFADNRADAKSKKEILLGNSESLKATASKEPPIEKVKEVPTSLKEEANPPVPDDDELVSHILMLRDRIVRQGVDRERIARVILKPHVEPFISQELADEMFNILFCFIVGVFLVTAFFASYEFLEDSLKPVMKFVVSFFKKNN